MHTANVSLHPLDFVNFRTLDLNLLRVFDAVMAEGSLTRAAERLAMTQPAASHALKRLQAVQGKWRGDPRRLFPAVRLRAERLAHGFMPANNTKI